MSTPKKSRNTASSKDEGQTVPTGGGDAQAARVTGLTRFLEESSQYDKTAEQTATAQFVKLSSQYDKSVQEAEQGLEVLYEMATGSHHGMAESAAHALIRILSNSLHQLNQPVGKIGKAVWSGNGPTPSTDFTWTGTWPTVFSNLARERDCWPILYYIHRDQREDLTLDVIRGLHVGAALGINLDGKSFSLETIANTVVLNLVNFIRQYRGREFEGYLGLFVEGQRISTQTHPELRVILRSLSKLRPLDRAPEVLRSWRAAGNALLPFIYGKNYDCHPQLLALWRGRKTKLVDSLNENNSSPGERKKFIRAAVRDAWKFVAQQT